MSVKKPSDGVLVSLPKPVPGGDILAFIGSLFDNPELSDFVLKSAVDGEKLHLHKLILSASPYFKVFFVSPVGGPNKSEMTIESASLKTIKIAAEFFYYGRLSFSETIDPHDFMSLCDLVEIWMLPKSAKTTLFHHVQKKWKNIMDTNMRYGDALLLHFENHPDIEVLSDGLWMGKPHFFKWNGRSLEYNLHQYLLEKVDTIVDLDIAKSSALFKLLSVADWLRVFVRLGAYGDIPLATIPPNLSLRDLVGLMGKHYNPKTKVFTPKQLSALKRSADIRGPRWDSPMTIEEDLTLKLFSLVPFSGVMFHHLGGMTGKSKRHVAIFVTLYEDLRTTFIESLGVYNIKLYVDGIYITFKSIYLDDEPVVDGVCFAGTNYSFALADSTTKYGEPGEPLTAEYLPSTGLDVFWVEEV
jgi:hypothetical protein